MPAAIDNSAIYQNLGLGQAQRAEEDSGALGLDQFLKLMTTQLNHQDPMEPMDNGEFLGQIAQFGTVTGIEQLNDSFGSFSSSITNGQALEAGNLIGRDVLAPATSGYLTTGGSIKGRVELESSASSVKVTVTDQYGQLVRNENLGSRASGPLDFEWNGLDDNGEYMPSGKYSISVTAVSGFSNEALATQIYNKVDSVTIGSGVSGLTLNVAGSGKVDFSEITAIK